MHHGHSSRESEVGYPSESAQAVELTAPSTTCSGGHDVTGWSSVQGARVNKPVQRVRGSHCQPSQLSRVRTDDGISRMRPPRSLTVNWGSAPCGRPTHRLICVGAAPTAHRTSDRSAASGASAAVELNCVTSAGDNGVLADIADYRPLWRTTNKPRDMTSTRLFAFLMVTSPTTATPLENIDDQLMNITGPIGDARTSAGRSY